MTESEKRPDKFWLVFGLVALCFVLVAAPIALCAGLLLPALQKARAAAMQQQIQAEEDAREAAEAAAKRADEAAAEVAKPAESE